MNNLNIIRISALIILGSILHSCSESETPSVITSEITAITESTATSGGTIQYGGSDPITARGVCWNTSGDPEITDDKTSDGPGAGTFSSSITGLDADTKYYVKAYATTEKGTSYGDEKSFTTASPAGGQITADHRIVDRFDDIPQEYINKVKEMWLVYAGESHSVAIREGLSLLETIDSRYQVNVTESGTPQTSTSQYLRVSRATWGDLDNPSGWIYNYGEEDWFTSTAALNRTKAGLTYCNTNGYLISVFAFGWCWDDSYGTPSTNADPVFGVHWSGVSEGGPEGNRCWGLDDGDFALTGNSVCMDTYLQATKEYIDHCTNNGYDTKVIFTTPPVDTYYRDENGYQSYLKQEHIRNYVKADPSRILFDYSDILCYDDNGSLTTRTWNGNTYPSITPANLGDESIGHIGSAGAVRLAKAMWWMLARIAGWDGK